MSRKPFIVNNAMREKVRYLAGVGVPQDDIAKIIGCAPKTLRKRFRAELHRGAAEAYATMASYLFAAAKGGNIAAIIFWLKTRARWHEPGPTKDAAAEGGSDPYGSVVIYLPDNGRDPELTKVLRRAQREAQLKYYKRRRKERGEDNKR